MTEFSENQIDLLTGNFSSIGKAVGCTREYVSKVVHNKVKTKRKSPKANAVIKKARELLAVLQSPKTKNNKTMILSTNEKLKNEIKENVKLIADLNAFAHTVAHDLRDSISAIVSASELMKSEIVHGDYQFVAKISEMICLSANKTFQIVNELLAMATIRQQDIRLEKIDMETVIAECELRLGNVIQQTGATIIKPGKWPVIKANPAWLEEVWVNYIDNAIKYGGNPPVIELGAEQLFGENKIKFWIKDNGDGLTKKEQEKLFTEFSRVKMSKAQGTGLGLSIVKRIVQKMGGDVGVLSNATRGEGCIFYFMLSSPETPPLNKSRSAMEENLKQD